MDFIFSFSWYALWSREIFTFMNYGTQSKEILYIPESFALWKYQPSSSPGNLSQSHNSLGLLSWFSHSRLRALQPREVTNAPATRTTGAAPEDATATLPQSTGDESPDLNTGFYFQKPISLVSVEKGLEEIVLRRQGRKRGRLFCEPHGRLEVGLGCSVLPAVSTSPSALSPHGSPLADIWPYPVLLPIRSFHGISWFVTSVWILRV
jgi:hypothetical protein